MIKQKDIIALFEDKEKKEEDLQLLLDDDEEPDAFDKCTAKCDGEYEKCDKEAMGDIAKEDNCATIYNDCGANCEDAEESSEDLDEAVNRALKEQTLHRSRGETATVNGRKITRFRGTYNRQDPTAFVEYDLGDGYKLQDVTWGWELSHNDERIKYSENQRDLDLELGKLGLSIDAIKDAFHEVDEDFYDPITKYYGFSEAKKHLKEQRTDYENMKYAIVDLASGGPWQLLTLGTDGKWYNFYGKVLNRTALDKAISNLPEGFTKIDDWDPRHPELQTAQVNEAKEQKAPRVTNIKWSRGGVLGPRSAKVPEEVYREYIKIVKGGDGVGGPQSTAYIKTWLSRKFRGVPKSFEWSVSDSPIKESKINWSNGTIGGIKVEIGDEFIRDYPNPHPDEPHIVSDIVQNEAGTWIYDESRNPYPFRTDYWERDSNGILHYNEIAPKYRHLRKEVKEQFERGYKVFLNGKLIGKYMAFDEDMAIRSAIELDDLDEEDANKAIAKIDIDEVKDTGELEINDIDDQRARHQEERDEDYMIDKDEDDNDIEDPLLGEVNRALKEQNKEQKELSINQQEDERTLAKDDADKKKYRFDSNSDGNDDEFECPCLKEQISSEKLKKLGYKELMSLKKGASKEDLEDIEQELARRETVSENLKNEVKKLFERKTIKAEIDWKDSDETQVVEIPFELYEKWVASGRDDDEPILNYLYRTYNRKPETNIGSGFIFIEENKNLKEDVEINVPVSSDIFVAPPSPTEKEEILYRTAGKIADLVEELIENDEALRRVYAHEIPRKSEVLHGKIFDFVLAEIERA